MGSMPKGAVSPYLQVQAEQSEESQDHHNDYDDNYQAERSDSGHFIMLQ